MKTFRERRLRHRVWPLWLMLFVSIIPRPSLGDPVDDLFRSTHLPVISITLPPEGQLALSSTYGGSGHAKPKARATVQEGGQTYQDVEVQLKGSTTFQPLEGQPSLTLDFNRFVPGQRFHGLTKISLNNSLQDPTRLHEKFAREMFLAAGVPVPQADHALVTLNGRELGLYVLVEGFDKTFLRRHFADPTGDFFEAGVLKDIDDSLQLKFGREPGDNRDLNRLLSATRQTNATERFEALEAVVDLDRFFAMIAVEAMLCHSDSYSMNRNNYRLYFDPVSQRFVFLPHNMDRLLGTHRSGLDLSIVPPAMGVVARAALSTPEGRRRYVAKAGLLFTNLFDAGRLCERVHQIDAKIRAARQRFPGNGQDYGVGSDPSDAAADLCRRIQRRAAELNLQFAQLPNLLALDPMPQFDTNRLLILTDWRVRWTPEQPRAELTVVERDGRPMLQLRSAGQALSTTLYCRVHLPFDQYWLKGRLTPVSPADADVQLSLLRHSAERFARQTREFGNGEVNYSFSVQRLLKSLPEVEFIADVQAPTNLVWLDPTALVLRRGEPR